MKSSPETPTATCQLNILPQVMRRPAIAEQVAYNVAVVHPDELNVRSNPSEDGEVIDVAYSSEELEVVAYDNDWMKVALGDDVYGYVNAYYVEYKTYYPTAETLEEEAARLEAEEAVLEEDRGNGRIYRRGLRGDRSGLYRDRTGLYGGLSRYTPRPKLLLRLSRYTPRPRLPLRPSRYTLRPRLPLRTIRTIM